MLQVANGEMDAAVAVVKSGEKRHTLTYFRVFLFFLKVFKTRKALANFLRLQVVAQLVAHVKLVTFGNSKRS